MTISKEYNKENNKIIRDIEISEIRENIPGICDITLKFNNAVVAMVSIPKNINFENIPIDDNEPSSEINFWKQENNNQAIQFWEQNGGNEYYNMNIIESYYNLCEKIIEKAKNYFLNNVN